MADTDSERGQSSQLTFKPSFVIVAIDTHPCMFETRENEDGIVTHPFKDAITACYEVADSLILVSNRRSWNQFGVVLVDTDHKATLIEVQNNLLESIKLLKHQAALSNEELKQKYERQGDLDLAGFLLLCKKKFKDINAAYYKRTIIFITNDEDPLKADAQKRFNAFNEARTFEASDIDFQLVVMRENFNYNEFYDEFFAQYSNPPTQNEICEDKEGLVEKLMSSIVFRYRRLKYYFFPFKNDYQRYLQVFKVNFIRKAKLYNTHRASRDGHLLKRVHERYGMDAPNAFTFKVRTGIGQEPIKLDLKDKYDIFGNRLPLGFHLQYVSDRHTDSAMSSSSTELLVANPKEELDYFNQFWQYCASNDKVLVCVKKYRHPEKVRFVELIPKYANKTRMFLIKHIPFCKELRWPKRIETATFPSYTHSNDRIECVHHLVDSLTFNYHPKMLEDPRYARKKAFVKAKLLDEPLEEVDTVDVINVEEMNKQISEIVTEIKQSFGIQETVGRGIKRKKPTRGKKVAKKY